MLVGLCYTVFMIRDRSAWTEWERGYRRRTAVNYLHNLQIYGALYEEAMALGVLPAHDPLKRVEEKARMAKALNDPLGKRFEDLL